MFEFIKEMFVVTTFLFSCNALNVNPLNSIPLKYISMNNQECRIRPEIINIISNEHKLYPYSIKVSKCRGS